MKDYVEIYCFIIHYINQSYLINLSINVCHFVSQIVTEIITQPSYYNCPFIVCVCVCMCSRLHAHIYVFYAGEGTTINIYTNIYKYIILTIA